MDHAKQIRACKKKLVNLTLNPAAERNRAIMPGKSPLSFRLFSFLLEQNLRADSEEFEFGRTFMLISWNLMCRASNAVDVKPNIWGGIKMHFIFVRTHEDRSKGGEGPHPRHIYAYSGYPNVCPILGLGIYFTIFDFDQCSQGSLVAAEVEDFIFQLKIILLKIMSLFIAEIPGKAFGAFN
jgi:hypothetical protein